MVRSKPYSAVSTGIDDDVNYTDNTPSSSSSDGGIIIPTNSLDEILDNEQDEIRVTNNGRSIKCKIIILSVVLVTLVFGGHTYYAHGYNNNGDDGGGEGLVSSLLNKVKPGEVHGDISSSNNSNSGDDKDENTNGNIRGSTSNDYDWGNNNNIPTTDDEEDVLSVEDDVVLYEGEEDDFTEDLQLVEGQNDDENGIEEFEGDLDDEISNGEVESEEFDSDMDYDNEEEIEFEDPLVEVTVEEEFENSEINTEEKDVEEEEEEEEEDLTIIEEEAEEDDDWYNDGGDGEGEVIVDEEPLTFETNDEEEDAPSSNDEPIVNEVSKAEPDEDEDESGGEGEETTIIDDEVEPVSFEQEYLDNIPKDESAAAEEGTTVNDDNPKAPSEDEMEEGGGEGDYDEYDWKDLPPNVQSAASILGWTQETWDADEYDPDSYELYWNELSAEQQNAALVLGYDEGLWNEEDEDSDSSSISSSSDTEQAPPEGEDVSDPAATLDEGKDIQVEEEEEASPEPPLTNPILDGDVPDYFVPLTDAEREEMKARLRTTLMQTKDALLFSAQNPNNIGESNPFPQRTFVLDTKSPKQFMHMHHMKTGGTSVDGLISCALRRQRELHDGTSINYNRMSECGSRVKTCMNDLAKSLNSTVVENVFYKNDANGAANRQISFDPADDDIPIDDLNICKTSEANVMSYCASLHAVRTFGWKGVDKITMIRNPIDRAWSMYKFSLNRCYKCEEMKDVLRKIADGTFTSRDHNEPNFVYDPNDSCAVQMIGHQATNMISSVDLYNVANDVTFPREQEIVNEAVRNLREEFTWIGITDKIQESVDGMRIVFPFLAENLSSMASTVNKLFVSSGEQVVDMLPAGYTDEKGCPFEHRNAGRDPTCGTTELDDETISLIQRLSARDVAVYKAAVERFALQNEVLKEFFGDHWPHS